MDWFLYDNSLRHERVNLVFTLVTIVDSSKKDGWVPSPNFGLNIKRVKKNLLTYIFSEIIRKSENYRFSDDFREREKIKSLEFP